MITKDRIHLQQHKNKAQSKVFIIKPNSQTSQTHETSSQLLLHMKKLIQLKDSLS